MGCRDFRGVLIGGSAWGLVRTFGLSGSGVERQDWLLVLVLCFCLRRFVKCRQWSAFRYGVVDADSRLVKKQKCCLVEEMPCCWLRTVNNKGNAVLLVRVTCNNNIIVNS